MVIKVCVGSSCHLKGSIDVIEDLRLLLKEFNVEDKVTLKADFCLGHCLEGVTLKKDEVILKHLSKETVRDVFTKDILPSL